MLLVRRRAGESILVGENVEIQVVEVSPSRVTIGIVAPREIRIVRAELKLTEDQNRAAAEAPSIDSLARLAESLRAK
jgi:carbon storage regulator